MSASYEPPVLMLSAAVHSCRHAPVVGSVRVVCFAMRVL